MGDQPQTADHFTMRQLAEQAEGIGRCTPQNHWERRHFPLLKTLGEEWLAEHPADDDELITGEWLESLGFEWQRYMDVCRLRFRDEADKTVDVDWSRGKAEIGQMFGSWITIAVANRGDMRRLLSSLGHESTADTN